MVNQPFKNLMKSIQVRKDEVRKVQPFTKLYIAGKMDLNLDYKRVLMEANLIRDSKLGKILYEKDEKPYDDIW